MKTEKKKKKKKKKKTLFFFIYVRTFSGLSRGQSVLLKDTMQCSRIQQHIHHKSSSTALLTILNRHIHI